MEYHGSGFPTRSFGARREQEGRKGETKEGRMEELKEVRKGGGWEGGGNRNEAGGMEGRGEYSETEYFPTILPFFLPIPPSIPSPLHSFHPGERKKDGMEK